MKRSSLAWYVAVACLGGSLCVGSVVQADSPTTVKANPVVPTAMVAQVQSTQPTNSIAATNTVANTVAANSEPAKAAVVLDEQAALKQNSSTKLTLRRWDCYGCAPLRSIEHWHIRGIMWR